MVRVAPDPATTHARRRKLAKTFAALGLGTRGDLILELADVLVNRWEGCVPEDEDDLGSLPRVGDYLINAVRTFGFAKRAVLIESTSKRLISRLANRSELLRWQLRLDVYSLAGRKGPDAVFNAALLELGGQVCRPTHPRCDVCPVRVHCRTGAGRSEKDMAPLELDF
jgi:A/G-specific adenine glycosylase